MKHETKHHFQLSNLVWGEMKIRYVEQRGHLLLIHTHCLLFLTPFNYFHMFPPPTSSLVSNANDQTNNLCVAKSRSEHLIKHLKLPEEPRLRGPNLFLMAPMILVSCFFSYLTGCSSVLRSIFFLYKIFKH